MLTSSGSICIHHNASLGRIQTHRFLSLNSCCHGNGIVFFVKLLSNLVVNIVNVIILILNLRIFHFLFIYSYW